MFAVVQAEDKVWRGVTRWHTFVSTAKYAISVVYIGWSVGIGWIGFYVLKSNCGYILWVYWFVQMHHFYRINNHDCIEVCRSWEIRALIICDREWEKTQNTELSADYRMKIDTRNKTKKNKKQKRSGPIGFDRNSTEVSVVKNRTRRLKKCLAK